jgi:enoyl-CoA hydratase/carnithine racemase
MPDYDYEEMKKEAEQYIKFEKDKKNRIAYITFDRPDAQNSTTLGMRQNYADLIHKCNVDDDVKVVVIAARGRISAAAATCRSSAECWRTPACRCCTRSPSTTTR